MFPLHQTNLVMNFVETAMKHRISNSTRLLYVVRDQNQRSLLARASTAASVSRKNTRLERRRYPRQTCVHWTLVAQVGRLRVVNRHDQHSFHVFH